MRMNIAASVLMIEPIQFGFNAETAASNSFQQPDLLKNHSPEQIQQIALGEFQQFVLLLRNHGIDVQVFSDTAEPHTPDSIFPNNWFSTHGKHVICYPMASKNRALERREDILEFLSQRFGSQIYRSLLVFEEQGLFLEGTGSLVIDHASNTAFAALSPRTQEPVLETYSQITGSEVVSFRAYGPKGEAIYHTNVLMCIGDEFAAIGTDCIHPDDRERVISALESRGKEIVALSKEQIFSHFAGNMLQVQNKSGERFIVLSETARLSLHSMQKMQLQQLGNQFISPKLDFIEAIGGGSARCMIAELF